jgi:ABC-2 type transport system permease protein
MTMLIASYSLSIVLMLALPFLLAGLLRRRFRVPWLLFLVGALTFAGSQAVHLPLNNWLSDWGVIPSPGSWEGASLWQAALVMGLTAGLCEELARTAGYALLRCFRRFQDGLMLGLGHGGLEAMIFGGVFMADTLSSLWALRGVDLQSLGLSSEQLALLGEQMTLFDRSPLLAMAAPLERLIAMGAHIVFSLLVWRAFQRRKPWYVLVAIAYHAAVDMGAVLFTQWLDNAWLIELLFLAAIAPGLFWLQRLWTREAEAPRPSTPWRSEWNAFVTATRKELLQQWRTKRLLAVGTVFVLFGLLSPLTAKFLPELVGSMMEGAEQFADLMPEPSTAEAIGQYIKNLTQFGFILAILMGMGAVAGEKEKGTAAIILSKPMPRWAFLLSKFVAQATVYLGAFAVASLGAAYYTWILFDTLDVAAFAGINLLLLLWLLVFVAVTMLGSALTQSLAAAAGVGLAGAVVLLLAGNLPLVGALAPGGLVAWASQLGLGAADTPVAANGGAAAMSLAIIVLCLIGALAAFERQEL